MRAHRAIVLVVSGALLAGCDPTSPPSTATPVAPTDNGVSTLPPDNGVSALPPEEVLLRATSALVGSRSFRVTGDFVKADEVVSIDLRIEGISGRGTVVLTGDGASSWTFEILRVGDDGYVKMPGSYLPGFADALIHPAHAPLAGAPALPALDQLVAQLTGRYVKLPIGHILFGPLAQRIDLVARHFVDPAHQLLQVAGPVTKGGATATIHGVPVIAITDLATADQCVVGAQCGTIYVATTGEPCPIRMNRAIDTPRSTSPTSALRWR